MKGQSTLFSHQNNEWETPVALFDELRREFPFILDVCANKDNAKLPLYIGKQEDGLIADWASICKENWPLLEKHYVWMNPPYSEVGEWVAKALSESWHGVTTVALLPARTDTIWFHDFIYNQQPQVQIRLLRGRLKFVGAKSSAPFPSMIVIFNGQKEEEIEQTNNE